MTSNQVDSRHLRYYVAVAEELSFRKAAERLHVAQPALTRQIRALEFAMQVQLLTRDKHRVALTPAGRVALERARVLLGDLDDLVHAAQRTAKGLIGTLHIGFISYTAYEYLPPILRAFRAAYPNVDIEISELPVVQQQFASLHDGRIDVAIVRPLHRDSRIATRTIAQSRYVVALPSGHPLLGRSVVGMSDLSDEEFITPPHDHGPSFHARILGFCARAGFVPKAVHEASDSQAIIGLVGAGMGVAVVPEAVAKLNTVGVGYMPIAGLSETAEIALAWRVDDESEVLRNFVQVATSSPSFAGLESVQSSPQDDHGADGDLQILFHPSGADFDISAQLVSAAANPLPVTAAAPEIAAPPSVSAPATP